jgi:predicted MPP superfamily phosphohydrolase
LRTAAFGAAAGLAAILLIYAGWVEPYRIRLEETEILVPGLPAELDGLRILHLSDLESSGWGRRERQVQRLGAGTDPDLVVVTGDIVAKDLTGKARSRAGLDASELIAGFPSRLGAWFVEGHGERIGISSRQETVEALEAAGIRYLRDQVDTIRVGEQSLSIVGLGLHDGVVKGEFRLEPDGVYVQSGRAVPSAHLSLLSRDSGLPGSYELGGEIRFDDERAGVGVTFSSRMHEEHDLFYRLRRTASKREMHLSPHGTVFSEGRSASPFVTSPRVWYAFRIRVISYERSTRVMARVWPAGGAEPASWTIDCLDATESRLRGGTIGLWAGGPGRKEFRALSLSSEERALPVMPGDGPGLRWEAPRAPDFVLSLAERIPPGSFPIVLSHVPDALPWAAAMNWPLLLAGHTQGGQVRLPFLGAITTDSSLGREYDGGLFQDGGTQLYINRGVGTTRIPFRFMAPPEVALLTLRAAPGPGS